jgi:hypothetical protein
LKFIDFSFLFFFFVKSILTKMADLTSHIEEPGKENKANPADDFQMLEKLGEG